ncbi:MAG TPA: glycoside hydrolase family 38 C-terminal domain-containing protein, partial [Phycisphaerae bacterium]|nr:glycoside hydrolase family 38 C-terminal domain-containing protein [Phycisphaerae bacterium]
QATYNWELGTIARGNNEPTKYEVPSHQWFDLTSTNGEYGVSILDDCKFGSDKPADNLVRLTLLYSPGVRDDYLDQHSQDWGRHDFIYALYGHAGDWRKGLCEWQGRRVNQPLLAFQTRPHDGPLGRKFALLKVSTPQVAVRAVKLAEEHDDRVIVRLQEVWGQTAYDAQVAFAEPIADAYEVDGQERRIGDAQVDDDGRLNLTMKPFSPHAFSIRLKNAPEKLNAPTCQPVALDFDSDVASFDADRTDGAFDADGRTLPAEELPEQLVAEGITFKLAHQQAGEDNALTCRGQTLELPAGDFDHVYLLAASTEDTDGTFVVGSARHELTIEAWTGFVGQWDNRIWDRPFGAVDYRCEGKVTGIEPGYTKRDPIAWFCTHRHHPQEGNEAYHFSYLFKYALPVGDGDRTLRLPDNPRIRVFAATMAKNPNAAVRPVQPLYDDLADHKPIALRHAYPPPPVPVFEGVKPAAQVDVDRKETFDELEMGAPRKDDFVDAGAENGISFRIFSRDGELVPHRAAGAVDGTLPRLNDGEVAQNNDDTRRCVWYDGEGRFYVDLQESTELAAINTYSWHKSNRAPQYFSLWGSDAAEMPSPDISAGRHDGWSLIAVVDTRELGNGGIHGSSIHAADGPLGPYRYLLWIAEDVGEGTFFTEIDVHAAP